MTDKQFADHIVSFCKRTGDFLSAAGEDNHKLHDVKIGLMDMEANIRMKAGTLTVPDGLSLQEEADFMRERLTQVADFFEVWQKEAATLTGQTEALYSNRRQAISFCKEDTRKIMNLAEKYKEGE